ncbi:hypothetical protein BpHYR1_002342 [Brachionus plicatilis]|uniref:Uncharacterized protein n=1 Tax=Brachionus plicatilis TaxID=10195 RepID=A0A3M7Q0H7_BRAPC|nr:hypothetical protein BpHYR1_002342 [Brachionus plicatilis]
MDISVYLNDINSVKKYLSLIDEDKKLNNYLQQLDCANKSEFFASEHFSELVQCKYNLSMDDIKTKFKFKLNQSVNETLERAAIESHLNSMTRQHELALDSNQTKVLDSMQRINKIFWQSLYEIKKEIKYENLIRTLNGKKLNNSVNKWLRVEFLHLQRLK